MSRNRHVAALAIALITPVPAAAQVVEGGQLWLNATVMGPVAGDVVFFAEVQPRVAIDRLVRFDQILLRPAIGYRLSPRVTIFQGFAHVVSPIDGRDDRHENRSFQQLSWSVPGIAAGALRTRSRVEQRWRSDGDDMQVRLRQMVRYSLPLRGRTGVAALGSVEGFFVLNKPDWRPRSGFDQVRTFLGVEVPVGGKSTMEIGYLNQTVDDIGARTPMNHVASVSIFLRR